MAEKSIKKHDDERVGKPFTYDKQVDVPKSAREEKLIRLVAIREEHNELKSEKSLFDSNINKQIKDLNKAEVELLKVIDTGKEPVPVEAWPVYDYRLGKVRIVEVATRKQIDERAMTPEETAEPILDYMEPSAQGSAPSSDEEAEEEAAAKANAQARDAKKAAKKAANKAAKASKKTVTHAPTDKPRKRRAAAAE